MNPFGSIGSSIRAARLLAVFLQARLDEGISVAACSKQLQQLADACLIAGETSLADTLDNYDDRALTLLDVDIDEVPDVLARQLDPTTLTVLQAAHASGAVLASPEDSDGVELKAWCQWHVDLYGTNAVTALKTVLAATPGESTAAVPLRCMVTGRAGATHRRGSEGGECSSQGCTAHSGPSIRGSLCGAYGRRPVHCGSSRRRHVSGLWCARLSTC
jgi:hypothetical protein